MKLVLPELPRVTVPAVPAKIALSVPPVAAAHVAWEPVAVPERHALLVLQVPVPPFAGDAETFAPFQ